MRAMRVTMAGVVCVIACVTSCNQIMNIHEGILIEERTAMECVDVADCLVEVPECQTVVACEGGTCIFNDTIDGTPLAERTPGDCAILVCDGNGGTRVQASEDPEDDENVCTHDTCIGGATAHRALDTAPCYTGPHGTQGVGQCHGGTQQCMNGVPVGGCLGEQTPGAETCDAEEADEDCDSEVNEEEANCVCGDGYRSAWEYCDDGNTGDCDGCRGDCSAVETGCGDGFQCGDEGCDDGGTSDGDSCSPTCQVQEVLQVAAGQFHTCAILIGGVVKCWGSNYEGQLGLGDTANRGDGPNEMGDSLTSFNLGTGKTAVAITAGWAHACAILNDASVKCWGRNSHGQLGLGDKANRGDGPDEMGDNLPAVSLGTGKTALAIDAGGDSTCVLLNDFSVKCWGYNFWGQLGIGESSDRADEPDEMGDNLPSVSLGTGKTAVSLSAGLAHVCALLDDASIKCWGSNSAGQLGLGDTANRGDGPDEMGDNLPSIDLGTGKSAVSLSAGWEHTCAVLNDASVKCWGMNADSQLGLGDDFDRGYMPNQMGDSLPAVSLGTGKTAVSLSADWAHTCALLDDASVKCWGRNSYGQLGLGDVFHRGGSPNSIGDNLPAVGLGTGKTAVSLSAGMWHTCVRLDDSSIKCWGANDGGQLGLGDTSDRGDEPNEMGDNLHTVKLFSSLW